MVVDTMNDERILGTDRLHYLDIQRFSNNDSTGLFTFLIENRT